MWPIFSRKPHDASEQAPKDTKKRAADGETTAWAPTKESSPIAVIDHIGPTAVATLTVTELTTVHGVAQLANLFTVVNHTGARHFVLDVQNLEYMDSLCLGCLVKTLNQAAQQGGRIALVNCEGALRNLFQTAALDRRFPICNDVPSALAHLEKP